jgi:hypothetical protein
MAPDNRVAGFPPTAEAGAAAILLTGQRLASILTRGALVRSDEAKKGTILMMRFGRR